MALPQQHQVMYVGQYFEYPAVVLQTNPYTQTSLIRFYDEALREIRTHWTRNEYLVLAQQKAA